MTEVNSSVNYGELKNHKYYFPVPSIVVRKKHKINEEIVSCSGDNCPHCKNNNPKIIVYGIPVFFLDSNGFGMLEIEDKNTAINIRDAIIALHSEIKDPEAFGVLSGENSSGQYFTTDKIPNKEILLNNEIYQSYIKQYCEFVVNDLEIYKQDRDDDTIFSKVVAPVPTGTRFAILAPSFPILGHLSYRRIDLCFGDYCNICKYSKPPKGYFIIPVYNINNQSVELLRFKNPIEMEMIDRQIYKYYKETSKTLILEYIKNDFNTAFQIISDEEIFSLNEKIKTELNRVRHPAKTVNGQKIVVSMTPMSSNSPILKNGQLKKIQVG